jgi:uncharacterized protein (DUF983 family)
MIMQRCPRCLSGPVFRRLFSMNSACPMCAYDFEREEGYFTGAMYISYTLALILLFAMFAIAVPFWHNYSMGGVWTLFAILTPPFLVMVPLIFRYSRVVWLHLDYVLSVRRHSDEPN